MDAKLDPQAEALLELLAGSVKQSFTSMTVGMVRTMLNENLKAFAPKHVAVDQVQQMQVPGPAGNLPARVYTPLNPEAGVLPGLVFFHGGGFIAGNLDTHDTLCRTLANGSGYRVVAIEYRLAPEHRFPAAVEDALAATRWIAEHAFSVGVDRNRLVVGGDSAGGNLAAVVCQLARAGGEPDIAAQLLLYPMTELDAQTESRREFSRGFLLEQEVLRWFSDEYLGAKGASRDTRISPLLADNFSHLPNALVVTAGFDPFRDEARLYAEKLSVAGIATRHICYETLFHGFLNASGVLDSASRALDEIALLLKVWLLRKADTPDVP